MSLFVRAPDMLKLWWVKLNNLLLSNICSAGSIELPHRGSSDEPREYV